jgi:hypothetical protein
MWFMVRVTPPSALTLIAKAVKNPLIIENGQDPEAGFGAQDTASLSEQ